MYQTVGHEVIEAFSEGCYPGFTLHPPISFAYVHFVFLFAATGLPLFRTPITGQPKLLTMQYQATEEDEVEDLFRLLSFVKV